MEGRNRKDFEQIADEAPNGIGGREGIKHVHRKRGRGLRSEGYITDEGKGNTGPYHKIHGRPDEYKKIDRETVNPNK